VSALPRADLLLQLIDEVRGLRAEVRAALEERRRPASDDERTARFLSIIAVTAADRVFSSAELVAHARLVPALRDAIVENLDALNARKLGRWLRRIEGRGIAGLRVERIGADGAGVAWRCVRLSATKTLETPAARTA
jgi:hypothetical protein